MAFFFPLTLMLQLWVAAAAAVALSAGQRAVAPQAVPALQSSLSLISPHQGARSLPGVAAASEQGPPSSPGQPLPLYAQPAVGAAVLVPSAQATEPLPSSRTPAGGIPAATSLPYDSRSSPADVLQQLVKDFSVYVSLHSQELPLGLDTGREDAVLDSQATSIKLFTSENNSPVSLTSSSIRLFTDPAAQTASSIRLFTDLVDQTASSIRPFTDPVDQTASSIRLFTDPAAQTASSIRLFTDPAAQTASSIRLFTDQISSTSSIKLFADPSIPSSLTAALSPTTTSSIRLFTDAMDSSGLLDPPTGQVVDQLTNEVLTQEQQQDLFYSYIMDITATNIKVTSTVSVTAGVGGTEGAAGNLLAPTAVAAAAAAAAAAAGTTSPILNAHFSGGPTSDVLSQLHSSSNEVDLSGPAISSYSFNKVPNYKKYKQDDSHLKNYRRIKL